MNGQASGGVAGALLRNGMDVRQLRPYEGADGRSYVTMTRNGKQVAIPLMNAAATLRKDEWIELDRAVVTAAKERLRLVADLRAAGLTFNLTNGMAKTVLQTQTMSDISEAKVSMNPISKADGDRPEFDITNLPLPVIHHDFFFSAREIAASRSEGYSPIDTSTAQAAARRVAETAEKLAIGSLTGTTYGGGTIYGLTNFPSRLTKSDLTAPTAGGWTPTTTVKEILAMRQKSIDKFHYGPWMLYMGVSWNQYLDEDYSASKGDNTLRDRLRAIDGVSDVRTLDFLSGYQVVLVQMTTDVVREVVGMDITTVQWETQGGMQINFKVMAILVPQLRADFNGNTGIVHGTVA